MTLADALCSNHVVILFLLSVGVCVFKSPSLFSVFPWQTLYMSCLNFNSYQLCVECVNGCSELYTKLLPSYRAWSNVMMICIMMQR